MNRVGDSNSSLKVVGFLILLFTLCIASSSLAGSGDSSNQPSGKVEAATESVPAKSELKPQVATDIATSGPADAQVVIVEFSDFQCPYCAKASRTMDEIKKHYGDKIRFEFRHFPLNFHREAQLAAEAAEEARQQGKFWEYRTLLFENARNLKRDDLIRYAEQLQLDIDKFKGALDNRLHTQTIERDIAAGKALGVRGTPAFIINGQLVSGAKPFESFSEIIDKLLEQ